MEVLDLYTMENYQMENKLRLKCDLIELNLELILSSMRLKATPFSQNYRPYLNVMHSKSMVKDAFISSNSSAEI